MTTSEISAETAAQIPFSSIPAWARPAAVGGVTPPTADLTPDGASYLVIGIGEPAHAWATERVATLPSGRPSTLICVESPAEATDALRDALASATVGVRVQVAGPVGACLTVRAAAVTGGIEDDELVVEPVGAGPIDVFCSHCRTVTSVLAGIDDVVDCTGCGRGLLVYYHVSRRRGAFLGFMADAETPNREDTA
ncbi:hypothetical protein LH935_00230 [Gordonia polyisoprenivorans]|uniref:dimethylamine monooxygenase subunit DmmA family protein n=1 Tax=Gordonia polyisoprenivorans TaxID=84595 RepID=UPI0022344119|nr:hypothetical protein LH935_00230 [Gordonia polyisoprenivorans]